MFNALEIENKIKWGVSILIVVLISLSGFLFFTDQVKDNQINQLKLSLSLEKRNSDRQTQEFKDLSTQFFQSLLTKGKGSEDLTEQDVDYFTDNAQIKELFPVYDNNQFIGDTGSLETKVNRVDLYPGEKEKQLLDGYVVVNVTEKVSDDSTIQENLSYKLTYDTKEKKLVKLNALSSSYDN